MERGPSQKKIEQKVLKVLAVIPLNFSSCVPAPTETLVKSSEKLAEEDLTPEEVPVLLEELAYSFGGRSRNPVIGFQEAFLQDEVKIRIKRGDLPEGKMERALLQIKNGVDRAVKGARRTSIFVDQDEDANIFCTFKASPSVLPDSFLFIPDSSRSFGFSAEVTSDRYYNEIGTFNLARQSVVTFRTALPSQVVESIANNKSILNTIKPKLIEEGFFFTLFLGSDHEIIGPRMYTEEQGLIPAMSTLTTKRAL